MHRYLRVDLRGPDCRGHMFAKWTGRPVVSESSVRSLECWEERSSGDSAEFEVLAALSPATLQ